MMLTVVIGAGSERYEPDLPIHPRVSDSQSVPRSPGEDKQVLFNFAGESARNPMARQQAANAGGDGLMTDYPLECRSVWREAHGSKPEED